MLCVIEVIKLGVIWYILCVLYYWCVLLESIVLSVDVKFYVVIVVGCVV